MYSKWINQFNYLKFDTINSTNLEAIRMVKNGVDHNVVISATQQTSGKGSKGRQWVSIKGNLHATILLADQDMYRKYSELSFVMANVLYDVFSDIKKKNKANFNIKLKWPNDVLLDGKKIAGLLLESIFFDDKKYIIIGFGINVKECPEISLYPTTSLSQYKINISADEVLNIVMNRFCLLYDRWYLDNDFNYTRIKWQKRAYNLNKVITVSNGVNRISGLFQGINMEGAMCLKLPNQEICVIHAGEVV